MDRRVARTRSALQAAFIKLILKQGYEAVTVEEICAEANIGRSTFYSHFTGKDDLKRAGLETIKADLQDTGPRLPEAPFPRFSLPMFRHAREHIDHYRALAGGSGGPLALASIRQMLADEVRRELKAARSGRPADVHLDFSVHYLVGAFMAVLTWWLDHGARLSPDQMDDMFRSMTERVI